MTSILSLDTLLLAYLILFVGSLTQSLIGFGFAIVASPLLYLVEPSLVPIPIIFLGLFTSLLSMLRERKSLKLDGIQYALIGRIPGGLIGTGLLIAAPSAVLGLCISLIVGATVLLSLFKFDIAINKFNLFIAGVLSGIFGNIAAIGGPPIAILLSGKEANHFRATLAAFFIVSSIIAIAILILFDLIEWGHLSSALLLLPAVLLGSFAAGPMIKHINKQHTRRFTLLLCSISALLLAINSISELN
jgi:uncharacterized membrane protein YfcA